MGEEGLEDLAGEEVEASDVVVGHVGPIVEGVQVLELPVRPVLPLYRRKDCLGHDRWKEVLEMDRHFVEGHQYQMDEVHLLGPQARGEDVEFPHHICSNY